MQSLKKIQHRRSFLKNVENFSKIVYKNHKNGIFGIFSVLTAKANDGHHVHKKWLKKVEKCENGEVLKKCQSLKKIYFENSNFYSYRGGGGLKVAVVWFLFPSLKKIVPFSDF